MSFFGKHFFVSARQGSGQATETMRGFMGLHETGQESWAPPADVLESDEGYVVLVEIPGVLPEHLSLEVLEKTLIVRGTRTELCPRCKKRYNQMEIYHGPFERHIYLPGHVEAEAAEARMQFGMLEVMLPHGDTSPALSTTITITPSEG